MSVTSAGARPLGGRRDDQRSDASPSTALPKRKKSGIPDALLVVATGVLLVSLAYARSREGLSFAAPLFWSGQVLMFVYVIYRVLKPSTLYFDRQILVLLYAGAQAMIRWTYSPHTFTFMDELQHQRSLENILTTNELFQPNYALPVSPRYPGLENITAELVQVSSASPFVSGVIICSVSHVLLAACLLLLFRELTRSSRVACIGAILYLLSPHASYFNTSFLYTTVALPFVVLAIFFAVRFATRPQGRTLNFYAMLACLVLVVITHHVSALAVFALLALIALATVVFRNTRRFALPFALCAIVAALVMACWVLSVAPHTFQYLTGPGQFLLDALTRLLSFQGAISLPGPPTPLFDRIVAPVSVLVMLGLLVYSIFLLRGRAPMEKCFVWLALASYPAVVGSRVMVAGGAELAGRALTFTALFTSVAAAAALGRLTSTPRHHRRRTRIGNGLLAATATSVVLLLGSITTGLPAWWQRLPGPFLIEGFASGIDNVGTSRAEWAEEHLTPGARFFGDMTSLTLLATLAQLDPVTDPGSLYYSDELTKENANHVRMTSAVYLDVDLRMADHVPPEGRYFPEDMITDKKRDPLEAEALEKFGRTPGISRIYDSGYDHFYDLRGGKGSPYGY